MDMDSSGGIIVWLFLTFWILAGLTAFGMSLVCFGYKGSVLEKIVGLLLAFFLGPFYWIYYMYNGAYCVK